MATATFEMSDWKKARAVDLVTFRRDGTPVSTPVLWAARDGALLIRTHHTAGKLKRLRHTAAVSVAPCDGRGRLLGTAQAGEGRILQDSETDECLRVFHGQLGLVGRGATLLRHMRGWRDVFIEVRLA